ncbi:hypothetical protein DPMN_011071 [Dreissena polymorpha]|uniref:Uncharacterized protein n=1 Tax=Dreissena polymorpha TaxID=45954 RepID=A0A9D4MZV9_DREPO|nr:hypothetical protein DPMN_011071 [Dreissena polymorpha]
MLVRILRLARFLPPATYHRVSAQRGNYFRHRDPPRNSVERTGLDMENRGDRLDQIC